MPVTSGIPQGFVLGPILFLAYINDLPDEVKSQVRLFAEEAAAYLATKLAKSQQLQDDLDILQDWEHEWDMEFNPSKCHVIRVTRSRSPLPTSYTLHGQTLEVVSCARYQGVDISNDLSWKSHITRISNTANKSFGFLQRNLKAKNPKLRERAFKAIVRPSWNMLLQFGIPIIRMIFLRLRWCREGLLDGSLVTTHPFRCHRHAWKTWLAHPRTAAY